jgi:hypothetical protein
MVLDLTNETRSLEFYMCLVIGNFGIVSNILNIIVSIRSKIQEIITMGFFNVSLSCVNIILIVFVSYLLFFAQSIGKDELVSTSIYACLFIPYFTRIFAAMSAWLNILITYDRLCIFKVNYDEHFINNRKHLKLILFGIFFAACLVFVPNLFFHLESQTKFDSNRNTTQIITICTSSSLIQLLRDASGSFIRVVLPILLQTSLNTILIAKLIRFRSNFDPTLIKEKRFAFTIIIFNIVYILGEIPYLICLALINTYSYNPTTYISTSSDEAAISSFAYLCSLALLLLVDTSLLPFVNFFTNKKYRKEVKKMVICL